MNFKFGRFFHLAISFILGTFFFTMGVFSIALPWSSHLQAATIRFLTENALILSLFGLGFALVGLSIVIYTFLSTRHHYAHVRIGSRAVTIDENLIEQYLEAYWKERFPQHHIPFYLTIRNQSLQIVANFPHLPEPEQQLLLEGINQDFKGLFGDLLGYPHDVHLIASFDTA
ncbi:conserved putative membrane protein [Candidatus Protochlamydia naegleriophila]|uniref:Conserved putative membrane protein n=1 Tax=Candidatus Protochlamydia naegleriophila TaxID=389348 RepID=A0A0U5JEI2_9BACT|nr:hypothetical protein [Candidatus Protochlamydia naegleriophila]CUI17204.1 conserved putative membrane protein [Candidatus Protochlamydia naegleriophila]